MLQVFYRRAIQQPNGFAHAGRLTHISYLDKLHILQLIHHLGFIAALLRWQNHWVVTSLIVFVGLQVFAANAGLHRYFAHHCFKTGRFREAALAILTTLLGVGSIINWVAAHRTHHQYTDVEGDPHSPSRLGIFRVMMGDWLTVKPNKQLVGDLLQNKLIRFLHDKYFYIHAIWMLILCVLGINYFLFIYCVPAVLIFYSSMAVVIVCHKAGYRNFKRSDQTYNNIWVSILTLGEGWHNNHHEYPLRLHQGIRTFELDPTAWAVKAVLSKS